MWLLGFRRRRTITIDGSKIDEALTDFPVGVFLSGGFDFGNIKDNGEDIRFVGANGQLLAHEVVFVDKANQRAEIWVKIPAVSSGQNTQFYMFYDNPDCSERYDIDPREVWINGYYSVYHMTMVGTSIPDSLGANHGHCISPRRILKYTDSNFYSALRNNSAAGGNWIYLPVQWDKVITSQSSGDIVLEWYGSTWSKPSTEWKSIVLTDYREDGSWDDPWKAVVALNTSYNIFVFDQRLLSPNSWYDTQLSLPNDYTPFVIIGHYKWALPNEYFYVVTDLPGSVQTLSTSNSGKYWRGWGNSTCFTMGTRSIYSEGEFLGFICDEFRVAKVHRSTAWNKATLYSYQKQLLSISDATVLSDITSVYGYICDPQGNPISGTAVPILVLDPLRRKVVKVIESSTLDGSWAFMIYKTNESRMLLVYYTEQYGNYTDLAGAELD